MEKDKLALKHSLGKCSLDYYISSKFFFSVAGSLKRSNEMPLVLQTSYFDPKYLAID